MEPIYLTGIIFFLFGFIFWRKAIIFSLVWAIFVGAIRKWLFPQAHEFIFFSTNLILFGAYIRFFILRGKFAKHKINFLLRLLLCWGLIEVFNPSIPNILVGILGLVIYFSYIPMAYMLPYVFETKEKILSFLKFYSILAIPILFLGVIQFFSPADSPINRYVREDVGIAVFGKKLEHARVSGTFSYLSGYATYLGFMILIFVYLITAKKLSKKLSVILYILIGLCVVNLFMTGSRGAVWMSALLIVVYFFTSGISKLSYLIKMFPRIIIVGLMIFLIIMATRTGKESYRTFVERAEGKDIGWRTKEALAPFPELQKAGIFGYGIGTYYQGASYIVAKDDSKWRAMPSTGESESMRVLLELGLIGYMLVYVLRFLFIKYSWELSKRIIDKDLKSLCLITMVYQLQYVHFGNLVYNTTAGMFYWFFVGFLFLLPKLDSFS